MNIKVIASIFLSVAIAFLVYFFNKSLFSGLDSFLYAAYVIVILMVTTVDVFLIIRQKVRNWKMIMVIFLVLSLLSSMIVSRIYIPSGDTNGVPRRYVEP